MLINLSIKGLKAILRVAIALSLTCEILLDLSKILSEHVIYLI